MTKSMFGSSSHIWVEGEGIWNVVYNKRHVETETFKLEKQRNKLSFLPAIDGDSTAILFAYLLNLVSKSILSHFKICSFFCSFLFFPKIVIMD